MSVCGGWKYEDKGHRKGATETCCVRAVLLAAGVSEVAERPKLELVERAKGDELLCLLQPCQPSLSALVRDSSSGPVVPMCL